MTNYYTMSFTHTKTNSYLRFKPSRKYADEENLPKGIYLPWSDKKAASKLCDLLPKFITFAEFLEIIKKNFPYEAEKIRFFFKYKQDTYEKIKNLGVYTPSSSDNQIYTNYNIAYVPEEIKGKTFTLRYQKANQRHIKQYFRLNYFCGSKEKCITFHWSCKEDYIKLVDSLPVHATLKDLIDCCIKLMPNNLHFFNENEDFNEIYDVIKDNPLQITHKRKLERRSPTFNSSPSIKQLEFSSLSNTEIKEISQPKPVEIIQQPSPEIISLTKEVSLLKEMISMLSKEIITIKGQMNESFGND